MFIKKLLIVSLLVIVPQALLAQDILPQDNGLATYHASPQYRETESHPLRVLGYVLHPIGWVAREVIFRPFSYFASSSETSRSVLGYREPYDYRQPECFSADDTVPDCRAVNPFNYDAMPVDEIEPVDMKLAAEPVRQVYFPDVNFDFDVRKLNNLGEGRARQLAQLLESEPGLKVVLEGHADFVGSETYNEKLGMDRAEAVRQELVSLGVSPERLSTVTFGKSKPVFAEEQDWARAVNRRVEVHVDDTAAIADPEPVS